VCVEDIPFGRGSLDRTKLMSKSGPLTEWLQEHRILQINLQKLHRLDDKIRERTASICEIKTYKEIRRMWGSIFSHPATAADASDGHSKKGYLRRGEAAQGLLYWIDDGSH
jgi:hypothetical protein